LRANGSSRAVFGGREIPIPCCHIRERYPHATIIILDGGGYKKQATENAPPPASLSASQHRAGRAEDVLVVAIIVAPLKLSDVQRKIFATYPVVAAHNAALQERPETVDSLPMHNTIDILPRAMTNNAVLFQIAISRMVIGRNQV
jgi:hypothetical protein